MNCREILDFLADYVRGALPARELGEFDAHLTECPECVAYLDSYRKTIELGRAAFCEQQPEPAPQRLIDAILRSRRD